MELFSIRDYFKAYILSMNNETVLEKQLTYTEMCVLVECCALNFEGVDLTDFDELWQGISKSGLLRTKNYLSGYKTKLGEKSWIKCKRNEFTLPKSLDIKKTDKGFSVYKYVDDKWIRTNVDKLAHNVNYVVNFKNMKTPSGEDNGFKKDN